MITFTKEQLSEVMRKHAEKENGLYDLTYSYLQNGLRTLTAGLSPAKKAKTAVLPDGRFA